MAAKDFSQQNLLDDVKFWSDEYQRRTSDGDGGYSLPLKLLQDFYSFCEQYVAYSEEVHQELVGVLSASSEHVRYRVSEVMLEEWAGVSRVVEQREQQGYREFLRDIEKRALRHLPEGAPGVVGYLGHASTLRYQHYSSISVAGIPRDQLQLPGGASVPGGIDYATAIPHEVGHHVWHLIMDEWGASTRYDLGVQTKEVVHEALNKHESTFDLDESLIESIANLLDSWLAETFADVYGAYVGGAAYVDSLVKILHRRIGVEKDLFVNDGRHALAYLRPFIRTKVLALQGDYDDAARIREEWRDFTRGLGVQDEQQGITFLAYSKGRYNPMPLQAEMAFEIINPRGKAFSYRVPRTQGHLHEWREQRTSLRALRVALDVVIEDVLFPIVSGYWAEEYPVASQFTFGRFKGYINSQIEQNGDEALLLLLQPFSTLFGAVPANATGSGGGGKFVGSHTHNGSYHTHTVSGAIIIHSSK